MKKVFVALTASLVFATAHAVLITDNFNRADTAFASNNTEVAASIGSNWMPIRETNSQYRIYNNAVDIGVTEAGVQKASLIYTGAGTLNAGAGTDFTLSATLRQDTTAATGFIGLIFNYQNDSNYYLFRLSGAGAAQMVAYSNGVAATVLNTAPFTPVQNRPYTFTVSSADPYTFDLSIFDTVAGSAVYSNSLTLAAAFVKHQDGLGGMHATSGLATMDDFSLNVIPEPATIGMLSLGALAVAIIRRFRTN
jgi:hypothetical protein